MKIKSEHLCCLNAIDIYDLTDGKLIDLSIELF